MGLNLHLLSCIPSRAQRVGFFNIGSGRVGYWTKYRVAGRVGSGRSVEIYDRVFPGIFFTLGYFRVCRVFSGIYGYVGYLRVYTGILDIISFLVVVSKILRFLKVENLVIVKCNAELHRTMKN